jgi:membrane associated rhomboid family serine protease
MVMPLYDDNPFKLPHRPIMTWCLIGANIVIFFVEIGSLSGPQQMVFQDGLIPVALFGHARVEGGLTPALTLVSYQFLHADIAHLLGNMIFLWVFGDDVEEAMGRWRFLAFYLLCGIAGGLAFAFSAAQSESPLIGASGSIAGIVLAYLMLRPCAKLTALVFGIPLRISAYWIIGVFIFIQLLNLGSASASEVAYWCHFGGMIGGAALFPPMRRAGVTLFECIRAPKVPVLPAGGSEADAASGAALR